MGAGEGAAAARYLPPPRSLSPGNKQWGGRGEVDEGARRPRGSTRRGGCRSAECSTRGHLKSPAAAFKGNPGPGSLCCAAGRRRSGTAGGAMPARPLSRWLRREPCGPGHGEGARRAQPTGRCGSPDSRPGQVGASGVRRPPRAGVGGGEGPEAPRAAPGRPGWALPPRARAAAAAAQKCRRAKKLTPASPPPPSPAPPPPPSPPSLLPRPRAAAAAARAVLLF